MKIPATRTITTNAADSTHHRLNCVLNGSFVAMTYSLGPSGCSLDEYCDDRSGGRGENAHHDADDQSLEPVDLSAGERGERQIAGRSEEPSQAEGDRAPGKPVQQCCEPICAGRLLGVGVWQSCNRVSARGDEVEHYFFSLVSVSDR